MLTAHTFKLILYILQIFHHPCHWHGVHSQNMVCLSSYGEEGEKERGRGKRREAAGRAVSGRYHASNSQ